MPLTDDQLKALIVLQVGDDAAGTLAANIDLLWTAHDDVDDQALHGLLTKRDAIDTMLGRVRQQVSFKALDGASVNLSDLSKHLLAMRETLDGQIESAQAGVSAGAIGLLTQTAPIMRDNASQADPNSRALRGDPLRRRGVCP